MKRLLALFVSTLMALFVAACAAPPKPLTIGQTVAATPQLSTLARLLVQADLAGTLDEPGPFTLFAPSDDAFKAVPAATLDAIAKDKSRLKAVLSFHVVPGAIAASEAKNGAVKTAQGSNVSLYRSGTFLTVEEALVTTPDIRATNGVIHIVDKVLIPPAK
jgi:uncharacterized surface protein with fasciclin (FAS1) repeats